MEVLVGQGYVDDELRLEGLHQRHQLGDVVGVHSCGLYLDVLDLGGDLVALALGATSEHDLGEDITVLRHLLGYYRADTAGTDNEHSSHRLGLKSLYDY